MDGETVRRFWEQRDGEFSPGYYAYYGPNETSRAIRKRLDEAIELDGSVLELGCSAGRHLAHLHDHGYTDLSGIDVNDSARSVMRETYPELAEAGTFYFEAIESVLERFADDQFDAVFSVQTLQHIHPESEWVFDELARITESVLITAEVETEASAGATEPTVQYVDEGVPLFYRDWRAVFTDRGFTQVDSMTVDRSMLRVFQPP